MVNKKKSRIQKIIQLLENNEDDKTLTPHIIEIEQIFFECFNNENKINRRIINTYVIPFVNTLLERTDNEDAKINCPRKEKLLERILIFFSSILRINKNYAYLIVSYFVNLIEQKSYIVKIIDHLKKIIIHLLKGLLFSNYYFHKENDSSIYENEEDKKNELNNIKQGFHNYVILKSKIFNILTNFHFDKSVSENPYKYDLIKNLMLILTKEILFFFHILKNKKSIFKEILSEQKQVHHVINEVFDISYLNVITDRVNMNNYDEIILIWLEQDIRFLNDLILFNLSQNVNNTYNYTKCEPFVNKIKEKQEESAPIDGHISISPFSVASSNDGREEKLKYERNVKKEFIIKREKDEEQTTLRNEFGSTNAGLPKLEIFNKLISHFNGMQDVLWGKKEEPAENFMNYENGYQNGYQNKWEVEHEHFPSDKPCEREGKEDSHELLRKYLISTDCLIRNIDQITKDSIVFLTHLIRNVFYLIREVPFLLNFFHKNIFVVVSELVRIQTNITDEKINYEQVKDNINIGEDGFPFKGRNGFITAHEKTSLSNYKKKLFNCMLHYIKNELYLLLCKTNVNLPFYYAYVTILLNLLGEKGTTDELTKKKRSSMRSMRLDLEIEKKRKVYENNYNYTYEYLKTNILRKDFYGYKKLKNEQVDIMSYLKVKMNEKENEDLYKKEERENTLINQIIKKLYLTNFKLDKEYYEKFDCFKKNSVIDLFHRTSNHINESNDKALNEGRNCHSEFSTSIQDVYQKCDRRITSKVGNKAIGIYEEKYPIRENSIGLQIKANKCTTHTPIHKSKNEGIVDIQDEETNQVNQERQEKNKMLEGVHKQKNMTRYFPKRNYEDMYSNFLKNDLKYYDNVKTNDSILGMIELYYFLIFSQILNNNLESKVQVLGENIFTKKIYNLKVINNIVKRIILNDMLKEKLKFYFLILYIVKVNSVCIFNGNTPNDIFLNYSAIFKIFNNLLFYSYIQEKRKTQLKGASKNMLQLYQSHPTYYDNYDYTLGYTIFCYKYFDKLKKKMKINGYVYRHELQKKKFSMKCKYDEILNVIIFFLHNGKLLATHRDQYIKTFIEQILEAPKLSFSFFIYLIIWLNNIDVHIDYNGYINNSNNDRIPSSMDDMKKREIINKRIPTVCLKVVDDEKRRNDITLHRTQKGMEPSEIIKNGIANVMNRTEEEQHKKQAQQEQDKKGGAEEKEDGILCKINLMKKEKNDDAYGAAENADIHLTPNGDDCYSKNESHEEQQEKENNCDYYDEYSGSASFSDGSASHFDVELSDCDDSEDYGTEKTNIDAFNSEQGEGRNKTQSDDVKKNFNICENENVQNDETFLGMLKRKTHFINTIGSEEHDVENKTNVKNTRNVNILYANEGDHQNNTHNDFTSKKNEANEKIDDLSLIKCRKSEIDENIFNINYYIKYSHKLQNSSNYYIFCFSVISNLLKKNQNIRAKKTILAIYINTLFKSCTEIRNLLKKLITASKGIYNNTLNFLVYTKRIYVFYHKVFILFLLYICNMYIPHLKNDILFFSHFAFYLWPMELINFVHNFLITNFSFFYNDIVSIFVNYEQIKSHEKRMRSLKNYTFINDKLNEYLKALDHPEFFQSVEVFLRQTDFFNSATMYGDRIHPFGNAHSCIGEHGDMEKKEETANLEKMEKEEKVEDVEDVENARQVEVEETEECLHNNEISQKILLEEIFVRLFIETVDILEDNKMLTRMKKENIFLNFVSINYVDELCKFVLSNVEKSYQKNKIEFWSHFSTLLCELSYYDKTKLFDESKYIELRDILHFFLNSIDNFLSICVRSSIFFHLYLSTYSNCVKKEIRKILLSKFISVLPLLKSIFHEEFFRILKYNNNKWNNHDVENEKTGDKSGDEKKQEESTTIPETNDITEKDEGCELEKDKGISKDHKVEKDETGNIKMEETDKLNEYSSFEINIEIIKYVSKNLNECTTSSVPSWESRTNFLNFCFNLYLENNNVHFIIELIGFFKKEQILHIFNEIIKNDMEENIKVEILKCCINNIIKLPYFYILEKHNENENESYYITNTEIFYFYYNLNKNKNIQKIMLDYFVTKVNLQTVGEQEKKMYNDITIKDLANIIQQIAESSNPIFPIYGRFLCQITKNINILREFISSIIIPLLIQKKIWSNKVIWKGCLMCISMLWTDFKHSLFYIFFMLPKDECTVLFNALKQKYSITSDLIELISSNEQAKRICPEYLKNLINT
ncbi:hypothetical protein, conserved [Plasmodium gonderi]|uniref:Symplekin C-terminal domain-containing protein n=1 Tax=Plasmodium gonderi TaxID=77519 RepID=A0A1Y1JT11_PLAGO|nr:hypothetical protein, conserved [Plasmodium gonderi]GAW83563.1 hypothetical protein, conserved [Plasmodium gonderi]